MKQKTASILKPFLPCDSEKTWLYTTENNDSSYYRTLMRALKIEQFTWISLATDPSLTKYCGPLQSFLEV